MSSSGVSSGTTVQRVGNVASLKSGLTGIDGYGDKFEVPDFTIKDILKAIPSHCYERRVAESFYYVFRDLAGLLTVGYIGNTFIPLLPNQFLRFAAWTAYAVVQSLFCTGLWVMAHECGHQAFSDYGWLNDTVGWVLHSYLLVPYFSWKFSHSKHHKATGHVGRDMVFVPKTKERFLDARGVTDLGELLEDAPIYTLLQLVFQQTLGWLTYLLTNASGQALEDIPAYKKSHFNPNSALFETKDYWHIVLSDIGIIVQFAALYQWYKYFGAFNVLVNWFLPYVGCNHWLVFITYLQHSDPTMAHYDAQAWTFARGAATTIDREFGFVGQHLMHDIIETHVLHHFVSRIPFYNAREASEAIKKVMGKHYAHSDENMWVSLWKSARWCQYVDGDEGVLMYRNINNLGVSKK